MTCELNWFQSAAAKLHSPQTRFIPSSPFSPSNQFHTWLFSVNPPKDFPLVRVTAAGRNVSARDALGARTQPGRWLQTFSRGGGGLGPALSPHRMRGITPTRVRARQRGGETNHEPIGPNNTPSTPHPSILSRQTSKKLHKLVLTLRCRIHMC